MKIWPTAQNKLTRIYGYSKIRETVYVMSEQFDATVRFLTVGEGPSLTLLAACGNLSFVILKLKKNCILCRHMWSLTLTIWRCCVCAQLLSKPCSCAQDSLLLMICMHSLYSLENFLIQQSDTVQLTLKSVFNMDMRAPVQILWLFLLWFPGKIRLKWDFCCYTVIIDWQFGGSPLL